jgi:hypothetical protein
VAVFSPTLDAGAVRACGGPVLLPVLTKRSPQEGCPTMESMGRKKARISKIA